MEERATVLIVNGVEGDSFTFAETLRSDPSITLAVRSAVSLSAGLGLIRDDPDIAVVLLSGLEQSIARSVREIRAVRPDLHIVAVSLEHGTASVSLRDPNFEEFHLVIRSLLMPSGARADATTSGKLLKFRARIPDRGAPPKPAPIRNLPALVVAQADPETLSLLELALDWAEDATRALMTIWQGPEERPEGLLPDIRALARWLTSWAGIRTAPAHAAASRFRTLVDRLDAQAAAHTPFARVAALLSGDPLGLQIFVLALAGDLDMRFSRSFGILHDDLGRRAPSVGLACAIVAAATDRATPVSVRAQLAALDRLRALRLIDGLGATTAATEEPFRLDPRMLDWLMTDDLQRMVAGLDAVLLQPPADDAVALLSAGRRQQVRHAERLALLRSPDPGAIVLTGSAPGWIAAEAEALAGTSFRIAPTRTDPPEAVEHALRAIMVAGRLGDRRLIVDLRAADAASAALWQALRPLLPLCGQPPYLLSDHAAQLLGTGAGDALAIVTLPPPGAQSLRDAVALAIGGSDAGLIERLSALAPADPAMLPDAVALAGFAAAQAGRPGAMIEDDWFRGLRHAAGSRLPRLAERIEPRPRPAEGAPAWLDSVILPRLQRDQLRAVIRHVRFGRTVLDDWGFAPLLDAKGVAALFAGESGTGKTSAAHAIASELSADLYVIDLSQIVSKYIGETEKNLNIVFDDAQRAGAVLLFDEADALFGKRSAVSDAHDRYANIEVAYLLQRLQKFSGLAILTSNHPDNVDPAFARRLRFRVDFPRPSAADRLAIWEQSIPVAHRGADIDLARIAFAFDVTGGVIRQMAVHAAMLAAERGGVIGMAELAEGVRGELVRQGAYGDLARIDAMVPASPASRAA